MDTSHVKTKPAGEKQKALCVATRCTTVEQFVATFHRFCEDRSFFVSTLAMRPVGLETAFSIQLEDKTPVLRGLCVVVEAWATPANRFGRPGVRLDVKRLTNESMGVFAKLQAARAASVSSEVPVVATSTEPPKKKVEIPAPPFPRGTREGMPPPARATNSAPERQLKVTSKIPPLVSPREIAAASRVVAPKITSPIRPGFRDAMELEKLADGTSPIPRLEPPRATPSIGISTSSIAHSQVAKPAEATPVQRTAEVAMIEPASIGFASPVVLKEERTPGSSFVLPANPLMNISDKSLEGFIDCALYEETGNFFRTPGYEDSLIDVGDVARPPMPNSLNPVPALRTGDVSDLQPSYIGPMPQHLSYLGPAPQPAPLSPQALIMQRPPTPQFQPEATPIPMLLSQVQGAPSYAAAPRERPHTGQLQLHAPPQEIRNTPYPIHYAPVQAAEPQHLQPQHLQPRPRVTRDKKRIIMIAGAALGSIVVIAILAVAAAKSTQPATIVAKVNPIELEPIPPPEPVAPRAMPAPTNAAVAKLRSTTDATIARRPVPADDESEQAASDAPPVVGNGPCRMTINSTPAGSIVRVDGRVIGPSPITVDGPCKRTKVEVKHPRYALGQKFVNLAAGKRTSVEVPLSRPTHAVTIISSPAGATVSIAGRRAGTTPTSVKLMGFTTQSLTIEKKGYGKVTQRFYSKVANDRVSVKLTRRK